MVGGVTDNTIKCKTTEVILSRNYIQFLNFARIVTHDFVDIENRNSIKKHKRVFFEERAVRSVNCQKAKLVISLPYHYTFNILTHYFFHGWEPCKIIKQ